MRNTDTVTIDLDDLSPRLRARLESGEYNSVQEVVRDGLDALDREAEDFDAYLREKVEGSLKDPRPDVPMEEVFAKLERKHAAWLASAGRED